MKTKPELIFSKISDVRARWAAMSAQGNWYAFRNKPTYKDGMWEPQEEDDLAYVIFFEVDYDGKPEDSLTRRLPNPSPVMFQAESGATFHPVPGSGFCGI